MTQHVHTTMTADRDSHDDNVVAPVKHARTKTKARTQKPSMYKVYLLNDDFTPMDFVVTIIETIFNKPHEDAARIMLSVHNQGSGLCGVYTYDVAETKGSQVMQAARLAGHPLQCKIEKE